MSTLRTSAFSSRARWLVNPRALAWIAAALVILLLPAVAAAEEDAFTKAVSQGPLLAGGAAFLGGLLTALTPCVYPMIAITVSVFGAQEAKSRREAMMLSTSFVLGIVVLFTTMLVIAALTGSIFGSALQNKYVVSGIVIVLLAVGLSMFGAFEMVLPDSLMQRLSTVGGLGYGGAFALGLVSGVIAAPCTGPVLTGILLWIGKTQNVALGAIVGTTFSLGLGVPFWLVGTFAVALPKGGKWMLWVKSIFGIVIWTYAFHLLSSAFKGMTIWARHGTQFLLITAGIMAFGLLLGAVHLAWDDGGVAVKVRKVLGIGSVVVGAFFFWSALDLPKEASAEAIAAAQAAQGTGAEKRVLTWGHSEKDAVVQAQTEKRPLLVDFTAEWCGACKRMAKETFSDPRVMAKAGHFVAVKVDATDDEDPQVDAVKGKYKVVGLPTVVVYGSDGQEKKRFNDFVGPEDFLVAIEGIQ